MLPALLAAEARGDKHGYVMTLGTLVDEGIERGLRPCQVWSMITGVSMRMNTDLLKAAAATSGVSLRDSIDELIAQVNGL